VEYLLRSQELHDRYGNGSLFVRFPWGKGLVYHMISHAFLQQSVCCRPVAGGGDEGGCTTTVFTQSLGVSQATQVSYEQAEKSGAAEDGSVVDAASAANSALSMLVFLEPILRQLSEPAK
jgi:hypothetical protein